jgi:hypothetical protein
MPPQENPKGKKILEMQLCLTAKVLQYLMDVAAAVTISRFSTTQSTKFHSTSFRSSEVH